MKKIVEYIIRNQNIILDIVALIIFLFICFVSNRFPDDFVIVQGDYNQKTFSTYSLDNYKYLWTNEIGQGMFSMLYVGYPFYYLLNFFEKLGFNQSFINSFILFIFLYGSFASFKQGIKIFNFSKNIINNFLFSMIYALNYFTFWVLSYSWGVQPHFIIYIFLPLIFSYLYKTLMNFNFKNLAIFLLINILSLVSYSNIVFGLLLFSIEIIFIAFLWRLSEKELNLKKILLTISMQAIVILPLFSVTFTGLRNSLETKNDKWFNSQYTFKVTSNSYIDLFLNSSASFNNKNSFLENNNEWNYLSLSIYVLYICQSIFIYLILSLLVRSNASKNNKFYRIIFGVFIILFILNLRYSDPFRNLNLFIFNSTFELLRSPDKIQPFFSYFLILLSYLSLSIQNDKKSKWITFIMFFLSALFFLNGGIVKSHKFEKTSNGYNYSSLVKVPQEYLDLQKKYIGEDNSSTNILNLPYSIENSPNWAYYPKWKLNGTDLTRNFYSKNSVSPNISFNYLSNKFEFKEFNEKKSSELELINLMQGVSTEYIIYHKDITKRRFKDSLHLYSVINKLEEEKKVYKLESNEYFDFYKLDKTIVKPLIYSTNTDLEFQKINPTLYILNIKNLKDSTEIEFNQSIYNGWKLVEANQDFINKGNKRDFYFNNRNITEFTNENNFLIFQNYKEILSRSEISEKNILNNYAIKWKISKKEILSNFEEKNYQINDDNSINVKLEIIFVPQIYFNIYLITTLIIIAISGFIILISKKD